MTAPYKTQPSVQHPRCIGIYYYYLKYQRATGYTYSESTNTNTLSSRFTTEPD